MAKPIIVYIDRPDYFNRLNYNLECEALTYVLEGDYGCEVLHFDDLDAFEEKFERIQCLANSGFVMLFVITQDEYRNFPERFVKTIRSNLNPKIPIAVFANWLLPNKFEGIPGDDRIFVFNHADAEFLELLKKLRAGFKLPVNYYGAETEAEQALLLDQLERSYRVNYLGDKEEEVRGVIPDHNSQIVLQALRIRLLPATLMKQEFDDVLDRTPRQYDRVKPSIYEREIAKIKSMEEEEFERYWMRLLRARGRVLDRSGAVRVVQAGCDPNLVSGFAIDPVTLKTLITQGFGSHNVARGHLANIVDCIEDLRKKFEISIISAEDAYRIEQRIISGLIFSEILDFQTPLLMLFQDEAENEDFAKVVDFLYQQKKFIPIYPDGKVIRG